MNRHDVAVVFRREATELLRDRRAIFAGFVLPVLLYPVLLVGSARLERSARRSLARREIVVAFTPGAEALQEAIAPFLTADASSPCRVESGDFDDEDLRTGRVHAIVRSVPPGEGRSVPSAVVRSRATSDVSAEAGRRVALALRKWREEERGRRLEGWGLVPDPGEALRVEAEDAASPERAGGGLLGRLLPLVLVLVTISAGSLAALDAFAGERERGTLETLLVHPVSPTDVAAGKYLAVLSASIVAGVTNLASLSGTFLLGRSAFPGAPESIRLAPGAVLAVFLLLLPTAGLLSALLVLLAGRARSFREGQNYVLPLTLVCMVPALAATLPGVELTPFLALVPIAGPALGFREVLTGSFPLLPVALAFASSAAYAAISIRAVGRILDAERLLREKPPESEARAARSHARRTLGASALALLAVFYLGGFAQARAGVAGVLFTLVGIVLPASFLVARAAGLSGRKALAFSFPSWIHLLAAVALVPGAVALSALLLFEQSRFLPLPEGFARELARGLGIEDLSVPVRIALLALAPGVCEEALFRGAILGGLRRDLPTRTAVAISALLFGAYHFNVYRFAPQAALGVLLGILVVRSGSLLPAILLHAGHNAFVLLLGDASPTVLTNPIFLAASAWLGLVGTFLLASGAPLNGKSRGVGYPPPSSGTPLT